MMQVQTAQTVVIDLQERILPAMSDPDQLLHRSVQLIKGLKILGVPILTTQQYTKGLGDTVLPVRQALGSFSPIEKMSFDCLAEQNFCNALDVNRSDVIVCGIETHICVQQTILSLIERGFRVFLAADAVDSRNPFDKEIALRRIIQEGAKLATVESLLFELLKKAGGEKFKSISRLVK